MARERTSARTAPRLEVALRAALVSGDPTRDALPVTTRDLGPGGALCESMAPVVAGENFSLSLELPVGPSGGVEKVALPARIIRVEGTGPYIVAIQFHRPPTRIVELLKRYLWRLS